jgi:hypothetical protein
MHARTPLAPPGPMHSALLTAAGLASQQSFDLARDKPLPHRLFAFMRLAAATSVEDAQKVRG